MATERVGVDLFLDADQFQREAKQTQAIFLQGNQKMQRGIGQLNASIIKQTELIEKRLKVEKDSNSQKKKQIQNNEGLRSSTLLYGASLAGLLYTTQRLLTSVIEINDKYTLLRSQIKLVIDEGNSLNDIQNKLLATSNRTRQEIEATTILYTRLDRATEELGKTDKEVIAITETINKALLISGASAQESAGAIRQFSQGLASGVLRGEELNSVLENAPRLARLLADGLGVGIGKLRELGAQGDLTSEKIVNALESQSDSINEEFTKVEQTVSQGWIQLTNSAESYLSKIDSIRSVTSKLGESFSEVAESLNKQDFLEQAKATSLLDRNYKQQLAIVEDLQERYDLMSSARSRMTKFQKEELDISRDVLETQRSFLPVIEAREERLKNEQKEQKKLNAELKKAEEQAFRARRNAALDAKLEEARNRNTIIRNNLLKDYNNDLLELIRIEKVRASERQEVQQEEVFQFERELILERENIEADVFQKRINRINQERDARLLAASEIAQTEEELIRFSEEIYINSAKKKAEIEKQQLAATQMATVDALSDLSGALSNAFGENKAFAIADIGFKSSQAIMQALTLPPPSDAIKIAAVGVTAATQLANVNKQKFADGTMSVSGPGGPRDDRVEALLSPNERIFSSNDNNRINGLTNSEVVDRVRGGNGDLMALLGLLSTVIPRETIAQAYIDIAEFGKQRGLQPT